MKISIITPDFSHNCLGRAYLLARVLQRKYDVEIIGVSFGGSIWGPLADTTAVPYRVMDITTTSRAYRQLIKFGSEIRTDIIYASEALVTSLGIGLLNKMVTGKPLILDMADWEWGFVDEKYRKLTRLQKYKEIFCPGNTFFAIGSIFNSLVSEKLIPFADEITVSNKFLHKKFGGEIVCHGQDTDVLNPAKYNKNMVRRKYGIGIEKNMVMFLGTPRYHKGIETLIDAVSLLNDPTVLLSIIGLDECDVYCRYLKQYATEKLNPRFKAFGLVPFDTVPELLSMTDIVVIPQTKNLCSIGQVPAKVFDAMAMAKPIISTTVSDLPEILEGCGITIEPDNSDELASTIRHVFDHSEEMAQMGLNARQKCIEKYSWNAMELSLNKIFNKYE